MDKYVVHHSSYIQKHIHLYVTQKPTTMWVKVRFIKTAQMGIEV